MTPTPLSGRLQDTLAVFESEGTPLTTTEVASRLALGRRSTYNRLDELADDGLLATKKVGASARVWWRPAAPDASRSAMERGLPPPELESIVHRLEEGIVFLTDDGRISFINEPAATLLDVDPDAVRGTGLPTLLEGAGSLRTAVEAAVASAETTVIEEPHEMLERWFEVAVYPSDSGLELLLRAVSERKQRMRELERYVSVIEAVGEPVYELDEFGRFTFVNDAAVERVGYSEADLLGESVAIGMDEEAIARGTMAIGEMLEGDGTETSTLEFEIVTKTGERYPVENHLALLTDENGEFRGTAGVLRDISERREWMSELSRRREQLEALNSLNATVLDITDVAFDQSTRREIEEAACERLATSESYGSAWVGEFVRSGGQRFVGRVISRPDGNAGVDWTETVSPPVLEEALATGELTVVGDPAGEPSDIQQSPDDEPGWSAAVLPIRHQGTVFGLFGVSTDRESPFGEEERTVLERLGEILGHAIAATQRKQALMSDEVVELVFEIPDAFASVPGVLPVDGELTFEHTVALDDDEYRVFGTATDDAIGSLEALVEGRDDLEELTVREGEVTRFEFCARNPPLLAELADRGGSPEELTLSENGLTVRVAVSPAADVRQFTRLVTGRHPSAGLVKRQQARREPVTAAGKGLAVTPGLTDRQRASLETAYYAGYFDWPRAATAEEIATSLDIAPSTLHQHLRKAERRLLDGLLAADAVTE